MSLVRPRATTGVIEGSTCQRSRSWSVAAERAKKKKVDTPALRTTGTAQGPPHEAASWRAAEARCLHGRPDDDPEEARTRRSKDRTCPPDQRNGSQAYIPGIGHNSRSTRWSSSRAARCRTSSVKYHIVRGTLDTARQGSQVAAACTAPRTRTQEGRTPNVPRRARPQERKTAPDRKYGTSRSRSSTTSSCSAVSARPRRDHLWRSHEAETTTRKPGIEISSSP